MIGFLAPDGKFTACATCKHLSLAKVLANRYYGRVDTLDEVKCEKLLLSCGWIEFRSDEVIFTPDGGDYILSDPQRQKLYEWLQGMSCSYVQKEWIKDILHHDAHMRDGMIASM